MNTKHKGLGHFEASPLANGSPIRFFWSGLNFLTVKEAKATLKHLTTVLNKVQPKTKKTTKRTTKKYGKR